MLPRLLPVLLGVTLMTSPAAAQVKGPTPFGKTADGAAVESYTLSNKNGVSVKVMTLGATITEINVPDKNGKVANVVLGFDDVAGYQSDRNQYFGCTVGRVANRIAKGKFTLDGKEYRLAINNEPNHLHGGVKRSLDKVVWKTVQTVISKDGGDPTVVFEYVSPENEEGYPGTVTLTVSYWLTDKNELIINYLASTNKATPINLTNHSYFNLGGAGADTVLDHELRLAADGYVPVGKTLIPTGKVEPVKDTIFDFHAAAVRIGARIEKLYDTGAKGYDHCFVRRKSESKVALMAVLREPKSGRMLTVKTDQPGVQVYTGNFLFGQKGAGGKEYKQRSAICLETGGLPDAVNQPAFPSIILQPGQTYRHTCVYAFSAE